jgi:NAD+ synthase (glutamine-hydrolysing)
MQKGIRIRCQQLNPTVGDFQRNTEAIISALHVAERDGIELLVLPELVVSAYSPQDLLESPSFVREFLKATHQIVQASQSTAILFGSICENTSGYGRPLFNSAILAQHGAIIAKRYKTLLPTYDVFDELRYFEPSAENTPVLWNGIHWGITICEDIWNVENERIYHKYDRDPSRELKDAGAEVIVNLSASPYTRTKAESRRKMLIRHAHELGLPFVYANQCGANTDVIFDGDSMLVNPGGDIVAIAPMFDEGWIDGTLIEGRIRVDKPLSMGLPTHDERTFRAITTGIRDYYRKSGIQGKAVVGLSGGIDSALVAALAVEALGRDHVVGLTMPSMFSSVGSVDHSKELARNLGIEIHEIPIKPIYDSFMSQMADLFAGTPFGLAEENLQSRIRGSILMAYSNKYGHLLLNTGNKSELAVGYCTLYGDMNGALGIISDLYKSEVYALSRWINDRYYLREVIPVAIIDKPPSAELAPGQVDSDSLPPYEILDQILIRFIEQARSAHDVIEDGFDRDTVFKVDNLLRYSEYKRKQAPPGLRLSSKAFGSGRRIPIVQRSTTF